MKKKSIEPSRNKMYEGDRTTLFDNETWLTTKEAAAYLRKTEAGLRAYMTRYDMPRHYLGHSLRFKKKDLDNLLALSPKNQKENKL